MDNWQVYINALNVDSLVLHRTNNHSLFADGKSNVVDFFIPFLPLERQHIVQCIIVEMVAMDLLPDHNKACEMADKIVVYISDDERRISASGCKRVARRLWHFMQ